MGMLLKSEDSHRCRPAAKTSEERHGRTAVSGEICRDGGIPVGIPYARRIIVGILLKDFASDNIGRHHESNENAGDKPWRVRGQQKERSRTAIGRKFSRSMPPVKLSPRSGGNTAARRRLFGTSSSAAEGSRIEAAITLHPGGSCSDGPPAPRPRLPAAALLVACCRRIPAPTGEGRARAYLGCSC